MLQQIAQYIERYLARNCRVHDCQTSSDTIEKRRPPGKVIVAAVRR